MLTTRALDESFAPATRALDESFGPLPGVGLDGERLDDGGAADGRTARRGFSPAGADGGVPAPGWVVRWIVAAVPAGLAAAVGAAAGLAAAVGAVGGFAAPVAFADAGLGGGGAGAFAAPLAFGDFATVFAVRLTGALGVDADAIGADLSGPVDALTSCES